METNTSGIPYNPAAVVITGGNIKLDDGTKAAPSYSFTNSTTTGWYWRSGVAIGLAGNGGKEIAQFTSAGSLSIGGSIVGLTSSGGGDLSVTAADSIITATAANGLRFAGNTATTTSRTELNKAVASIANAAATDVLTVTIPNAAHSASLLVRITCSLGAGGAIGANEATATNTYIVAITRTAGVATVAAISAASGAAAVAVAGAATVTATAAVTAMTGGVGAQQTFTVQATVSRSGGSSDNHTCLVYAQLMNANVTGITIA